MNFRLYQFFCILFSLYYFYASYKGYPSRLGAIITYFGWKKKRIIIDRYYHGSLAVSLLVLFVALEVYFRD